MRPPMNFPLSGKQTGGGSVAVGTELLLNATDWNGLTGTLSTTPPTSWYVQGSGSPSPEFSVSGGVMTFDRNGAASGRALAQDITVENGVYYLGTMVCVSTGGRVAMSGDPGFEATLDTAAAVGTDIDVTTSYYLNRAASTSATFLITPSQTTTQISTVDSASLIKLGDNLLTNSEHEDGWSPVGGTPAATPPTGWTRPGSWLFSVDGDGQLVCNRNGTAGVNSEYTISCSPSTTYAFGLVRSADTARSCLVEASDDDGQSSTATGIGRNVCTVITTGASATTLTLGWRPAGTTTQIDKISLFGLFEVP